MVKRVVKLWAILNRLINLMSRFSADFGIYWLSDSWMLNFRFLALKLSKKSYVDFSVS